MEEEPIKSHAEREKEYILEVKRTVRKSQLVDFVHFYYQHIDELTFNQAVKAFNELQDEATTTSI